jgi:NADH-quinone oxidoreductase subunit M
MPVFAASSCGDAFYRTPIIERVVEFLYLGTFEFNYVYAALGATGIILALLHADGVSEGYVRSVDKQENKTLHDINLREILVLLPIAVMMFVMGIFPKPFLSRMEPSVEALLQNKFPNTAVVRKLGDERPREARSYPESPE